MHGHGRIRRLLIALVLLVSPLRAAAQETAAAEGVIALTHGDVTSALRVLRPLTEGPTPDPVAQFFVAAMLDSTGGSGQWLQACRLYRKSSTSVHAFSASAATLADVVQQLFVPDAARCSAIDDPTWREPAPARFELAPGHVVERVVIGHQARTIAVPPMRSMTAPTALAMPTPTHARGQEPSASAQAKVDSDVDAGVRAFLVGDHGQAVAQLRPIAEHWIAPVDGTATFFMAMAYATSWPALASPAHPGNDPEAAD